MAKWVVPEDKVLVDRKHLAALEKSCLWLKYLKQAGVDNWEGLGEAVELAELDGHNF